MSDRISIANLIADFEQLKQDDTYQKHVQIVSLCDVLSDASEDALRSEPLYSFTLDVIDELMSLRVEMGSNKLFDNWELDNALLIRQINLIKKVVPSDAKMQNVVNRIFKG
ncbi:hypothetical protein [Flavobacterium sp.]|uniref:hypothetical protein n=1 Tax=Flavobacterium sp. TaxID=239 RepID=UPI001229A8EB|nr:hypothetical protein [Flavobacterium sp.]RZJ70300.1 MAG: hypothetical protein EOO49_14310 [Flavobacterium sp.]